MIQRRWITLFIGVVVLSAFVGGCATTGPTGLGPKPTVQSGDDHDPARGLDPNSPSFWLDYNTIYAPK